VNPNTGLGLLAVANLLSYVVRNVIFALFEPLKRDLHLADTQLGFLASAYVFAFALAALPAGVIGDLRSRRSVITAGMLLWSAFTLASGFVTGFGWLVVCRAFVGAGAAAFGAAAQSLVADYFPSRGRAMAMGILAAGITLGGVLGIWLGGHLEAEYGWRLALVAVSLPGFALAAFTSHLTDPLRYSAVPLGTWVRMGLDGVSAYLVPPLRAVLHTPTLVYVFVGGALISFGTNGLVGWAPTFMARELGLTVAQGAKLLGTYGLVAGIVGALCGGMVADWLRRYTATGRVITIAASLLIGGSLAVWLLTVRDLRLFVPVFCAAFFFLSWFNGPIGATIFDVVPAQISATVAGAYLLFIHLVGDTVAFPLVGALSDHFGLHRAVLLLPVAAAIGGLVVLGAMGTVQTDMRKVATAA
jgi:MFS family permease